MSNEYVGGRCLCGAIRFRFEGAPNWVVHCHCESCRRATSSPMTTWISVPRAKLQFTGGTPRYFSSSTTAKRSFCDACGSPMTYETDYLPDEIHIYAVSLDDPANPIVSPSRHVFVSEQLSWFEVHDALPRFATTSARGAKPLRLGPKS